MSNYRVEPLDADKRLVYDDENKFIGNVVHEIASVLDMYETSVMVTKLSDFKKAQHGKTVFIVTMDTEELFSDVESMLLKESDRHAAFVGCTEDEREMEAFRKFKSKLEKKIRLQTSQTDQTKNRTSAIINKHDIVHLSSVKDFENYSTWLPDMLRFLFSYSTKFLLQKEIGVLFPIKTDCDEPMRWSQEITKVLENVFQIKCALREPRNINTENDILMASSQLVCMHLEHGKAVRAGNRITTSLSDEEVAVIYRAKQEGCGLMLYVTKGDKSFLEELKARYGLDVAGYSQVSYLIEVLRLLDMVKLERRKDTTVYTSAEGSNFRVHYGEQRPVTARTGIVGDANIGDVRTDNAQSSNRNIFTLSLNSKSSFQDVCLILQGTPVKRVPVTMKRVPEKRAQENTDSDSAETTCHCSRVCVLL